MHPTYRQAIALITSPNTKNKDYYVAQLYADNHLNYLNAFTSSFGNNDNLFAYFRDSVNRSFIEAKNYFAFKVDMTPTHYKYEYTKKQGSFLFHSRPDYHTISEEELTLVSDKKIPKLSHLNNQYSLLFCDLTSEDDIATHIESYYTHMLRSNGELIISVDKRLLCGTLHRKDQSLYRERYNLLAFLSPLGYPYLENDTICFNNLKTQLNTVGSFESDNLKILPDILTSDFMFIWIKKSSEEKPQPTSNP
jgi:hypothetical protein